MRILLVTLTDDPFDPPGAGRFGGSHAFFFDLSRQFVRRGHHLTIVTRLNHSAKPREQVLGPLCQLHRVEVGAAEEIHHHSLGHLRGELIAAVLKIPFSAPFDVVQTSNWISGAVGMSLVPAIARHHVHHILSLGRGRLELGEEASQFDKIRDEWEQKVFSAADSLVCVTDDECRTFERLYPDVSPKALAIIPYGIDPEIYFRRPESIDNYVRRSASRFS